MVQGKVWQCVAISIASLEPSLCTDVTMAELARSHGNCNIICMGGRITGSAVAIDMVKKFPLQNLKVADTKKE